MSPASRVFQRLREFYLSVLQRRGQHEARKTDPLASRAAFRGIEPLEPRLLLSVLLFEGFEGNFPFDNGWSVGDGDPVGSPAYWGAVDSSFGGEGTHSGSQKGYCAGVGYLSDSTSPSYRDDMDAYMFRSIDLRGYSNANLSFWYKMPRIERGYDYAYVYIDGTPVWVLNEFVTSWTNQTISLNNFLGGVHTLEFMFYSDYSVHFEGWYLDDITVTVDATSDDPDDQFFEATPLSPIPSDSATGTISATGTEPDPGTDPGDVDMYSFTVVAGQQIGFDIDGTSGSLDSLIRLFSPSGTEVTYNDDGAAPGETLDTDSYLQYTFPSAGTYYMGVSSWENYGYDPVTGTGDNSTSTTGAYTLTLTNILVPDPDDQISQAIMTSVGSTVSGAITIAGSSPDPGLDAGDVDMYGFTVSAGEKVCFDIDRPSGNLDSWIRLFNSSGAQLAYNKNGAAPGESLGTESYLERTFSSAGTYYLGVSGSSNSTYNPLTGDGDRAGLRGEYTLTLSHPNQPPVIDAFTADPNPVLLGQTVHLEVTAHDLAPGELLAVSFFLDGNGNGQGEAGELIGQDLNDKDGWTFDWDTAGQTPPVASLLAIAYDDNSAASAAYPLTLTLEAETIPPQIIGWSSAATHGVVGEILLAIPDDGTFVDSRGLRRLVIQFSEAVAPTSLTAGSVQLTGLDANGNGVNLAGISISTFTRNGDTEGVIEFSPALPDAATYTAKIQGVTDLAGNPLAGDDDRIITALLCDADGDATVGASDYTALKSALGNPVSSANAAIDFDCSGTLDTGDLTALQGNFGQRILYFGYLPGDVNGDGNVDAADYIALKRNFGRTSGAVRGDGEFDGDGDVDWHDLQTLTTNFGASIWTAQVAQAGVTESTESVMATASEPKVDAVAEPLSALVADAPDADVLAIAASALANRLTAGHQGLSLVAARPANSLPPVHVALNVGSLLMSTPPMLSPDTASQEVPDVLQLAQPWWSGDSARDELPDEPLLTSPTVDILGKPRKGRLDPIGLDVLAVSR